MTLPSSQEPRGVQVAEASWWPYARSASMVPPPATYLLAAPNTETPMTRNPRVAVIDQDPSSRSDIHKLLTVSGFSVVGEAGYGIEAVSLAKQAEPDVVGIAVEEPMIRALQTVEALADLLPHSAIVGYSSLKDP